MPLPRDEQRLLTAIERRLTAENPKLAYLLTHWRRPPISMSIRRPAAKRAKNKAQASAHRHRQLPHRTQVIVLISAVIAAVSATIAVLVTMWDRFVGPEQSAFWLAAYFTVLFAGSFLVMNQVDRSIRRKDLGQRLFGIAMALLLLATTIYLVTLVPSIP